MFLAKTMPLTEWVIVIVAGVVILGMGIAILCMVKRAFGCSCHLCAGRMNFFDELSRDDQDEIKNYFEKHEGRFPDTGSIFVCPKDKIVYDDFSGERKSMEGDERSFCKACRGVVTYMAQHVMTPGEMEPFRKEFPAYEERGIECLACNRGPQRDGDCALCDTPNKVLGCFACHTLYQWKNADGGQYLFMRPLQKIEFVKEVVDDSLGHM